MRRTLMMLAAMVALMALAAGTAMAQEGNGGGGADGAVVTTDKAGNQTIQCTGVPCYATGRDDLVFERRGNGKNDEIILRGGDDQVRANAYTNDRDIIRGSTGFDLIYVDDGDTKDRIYGGKGNDKCYVDARSEVVSGCSVIRVR